MMNAFFALLEARDPTLGRFRSYRLEAGTDLLGFWLVEVTYGRINTAGHSLRYVAGNEVEARKFVHHCLRRRATAKKRIGVPYRFRELIDPCQWISLMVERAEITPADTRSRVAREEGADDRAIAVS